MHSYGMTSWRHVIHQDKNNIPIGNSLIPLDCIARNYIFVIVLGLYLHADDIVIYLRMPHNKNHKLIKFALNDYAYKA